MLNVHPSQGFNGLKCLVLTQPFREGEHISHYFEQILTPTWTIHKPAYLRVL